MTCVNKRLGIITVDSRNPLDNVYYILRSRSSFILSFISVTRPMEGINRIKAVFVALTKLEALDEELQKLVRHIIYQWDVVFRRI